MKPTILIFVSIFISYYSTAQVSNGSNFISASFNFADNPQTSTPDGTGTSQFTSNYSTNSYSGTINYGRFIKDNLAIYIGPNISHSESSNYSNTAYSDTTYDRNSYSYASTQIGLIIGAKKFFPLWQQKLFLTVNTALSVGYIQTTSNRQYSYKNQNQYSDNEYSNDSKGINSSFNFGFGAYFFINKHWAFTTAVNLFAINYSHTTGTSVNSQFYTYSTPEFTQSNSNTKNNNLTGQFSPSLNPFGLSWGLSYFF